MQLTAVLLGKKSQMSAAEALSICQDDDEEEKEEDSGWSG